MHIWDGRPGGVLLLQALERDHQCGNPAQVDCRQRVILDHQISGRGLGREGRGGEGRGGGRDELTANRQ